MVLSLDINFMYYDIKGLTKNITSKIRCLILRFVGLSFLPSNTIQSTEENIGIIKVCV